MRVAHVVRQFAPAVGGLEEAVLKLCVTLRSRNVDAFVVTLDRIARGKAERLPDRDTVEGVPVIRIPFTGSWRYPLAPSVLAHLGNADLVHVHAIDFFFDYLALTRLLHRKPMIASTHGGFFHTGFARRLKQVYFQTVTRTSALAYAKICASSQNDFEVFRPVAGKSLVLAENGVDLGKWADLAPEAPVRRMVAIGRLSSNKQLDKLIPLLSALQTLDPPWHLTIAGRAWDVEPAMLRQRADALQVGGALDILVDPDDRQIGAVIEHASYIVSGSSHEGFGIGVVEGMAAGLIPILNDIPPFRSLVSRSDCGRLIDIADPPGAACSLANLHRAEAGRRGTGRTASMAAASRFGWPRATDVFLDHYGAALGNSHAHGHPAEGFEG